VVSQRLDERISQGVSQALEMRKTYWNYFMDENDREYYIFYAQMQIARAKVEKMIDDFGKAEAADLKKRAAAEQDAQRRQQIEKAAEFFGGNLSSSLDF
jgi:hypothetical protein